MLGTMFPNSVLDSSQEIMCQKEAENSASAAGANEAAKNPVKHSLFAAYLAVIKTIERKQTSLFQQRLVRPIKKV